MLTNVQFFRYFNQQNLLSQIYRMTKIKPQFYKGYSYFSIWIQPFVSFQYFSDEIINISKRFNDIHLLRRAAAIFTITIVGLTNLIDMFLCASCVEPNTNNTTSTLTAMPTTSDSYFASTICKQFPSYFSNYAILILIATSIVVQLTHVCKFILMLIIAGKINNFIVSHIGALFDLISKMNGHFDSINHTMFDFRYDQRYNHKQIT